MADDMARFGKRLGKIHGKIRQSLARAALLGGSVIELRAKEILQQKGHIRTANLFRGITTQLGTVTKTEATALVGASPKYAGFVEKLPVGPRIPRSVTKSGRIVNRGEGGGFLFVASEEKLAAAVRVAGESLEQSMAEGAR